MPEDFKVGDAVEYEDAYTGELKHGRISRMAGSSFMVTTITEKEAGKNPKHLPRLRIACGFARGENGTPVCSYHRAELNQLAVHGDQPNPPGPGHFSAWICPVSGKQIYDAAF